MFRKVKTKISALNSDTKNQEYQAQAYKLKKKLLFTGLIMTGVGYLVSIICFLWIMKNMNSLNYNGTSTLEIMKPLMTPMIITFIGGLLGTIGLSVYRLNKTVVVTNETKDAMKKAKAEGNTKTEAKEEQETLNDKN